MKKEYNFQTKCKISLLVLFFFVSLQSNLYRLSEKKMSTKNLTLPNDVQEVPTLAAFVEEICEDAGMDMATTMQMNLAIEEAVVNVMEYAYHAGTKGEVRIEARIEDSYVEFIISDDGMPFNPTEKGEVDTTLPAEQRSIGGLGIMLVKHYMDKIKYKYVDKQNVLLLRKNLK